MLVNATYKNNLFATGWEWYGEGNWRWQDSRWLETFNIVELESYSLLQLRVGVQNDNWDIQLFMDNALDSDTVLSGGSVPGILTGNFGIGLAGEPPSPNAPGGNFPGVNAGPKLPSDVYVNMPDPRIAGIRFTWRYGQ